MVFKPVSELWGLSESWGPRKRGLGGDFPLEELLSPAQVASLVGFSYRWVCDHAEELGVFTVGPRVQGRPLSFQRSAVEKYIADHPQALRNLICASEVCDAEIPRTKYANARYCSRRCAKREMERRARRRAGARIGRGRPPLTEAERLRRLLERQSDPEWQERRRVKRCEYERRWRQAHPEQMKAKKARRRTRKRGGDGTHSPADVRAQFDFQGGICFYCTTNLTWGEKPRTWHLDHVVPISRGGSNGPENIVCACAPCNQSKHAKTLDEWTPPRADLQLLAA
jgi:5-methylcytosine-specific restriction endonuclease McrA